ncbi:YkoP family protein [Oceanobacillus bengalensis]|uniref:YkoP-like domain-containing protein n=1 Tax=Oceanobacillus bengalensis TaxID=1435466 RepID=A0A494YR37_9BACI|nr:hypothetical protein [Oceanobacillus bengalensis]RKQ11177.1 hypothetical protein D8M05_19910 [Oceanobacillus bengalensis]
MNIKEICISIWSMIDPLYFRFSRLDYIENQFGERTIMRVRLTKYKGRKITLSDGTIINKNDLLLKIHLHNVNLLKTIHAYDSDVRRAIVTYKNVQEAMPYLADYIQNRGYTERIKGLVGITTLHKGCKRLGFEVHPFQNRYYKSFKKIALFPIHLLSCTKLGKEMPVPLYLLMSTGVLLGKYSTQSLKGMGHN